VPDHKEWLDGAVGESLPEEVLGLAAKVLGKPEHDVARGSKESVGAKAEGSEKVEVGGLGVVVGADGSGIGGCVLAAGGVVGNAVREVAVEEVELGTGVGFGPGCKVLGEDGGGKNRLVVVVEKVRRTDWDSAITSWMRVSPELTASCASMYREQSPGSIPSSFAVALRVHRDSAVRICSEWIW
jgi:hypothetical protein